MAYLQVPFLVPTKKKNFCMFLYLEHSDIRVLTVYVAAHTTLLHALNRSTNQTTFKINYLIFFLFCFVATSQHNRQTTSWEFNYYLLKHWFSHACPILIPIHTYPGWYIWTMTEPVIYMCSTHISGSLNVQYNFPHTVSVS